jgi:hypothetical protein
MKRFFPLALILLQGCVSWHGIPQAQRPSSQRAGLLRYRITPFPIVSFGMVGYEAALRHHSGIAKVERVQEIPKNGTFVDTRVDWKQPSKASYVFGYISLALLTATPVWSTRDGYVVHYDLYHAGKKIRTYSYTLQRKGALWIGLLPLAWINLMTTSEDDALAATFYQFLKDSEKQWPT